MSDTHRHYSSVLVLVFTEGENVVFEGCLVGFWLEPQNIASLTTNNSVNIHNTLKHSHNPSLTKHL